MNRLITTLAAAALAASPALAQAPAAPAAPTAPARQTPPAAGPARPFAVPAAQRFTLDNGLKVILVPYGQVPKLRFELVLDAGNVFENENQVWLADLVGQLLREGTQKRTATQVAEEAARMGGSVEVAVGADMVEVSGEALSEFGADLAALVAEVASAPRFPETELDRVKADLARNLALGKQQPGQQAQARFRSELYGASHPYGRIFPKDGQVETYTADQVKAFYAAHYGPGRAHLYVSGRFDAVVLESAIRQSFGGWKGGSSVAAPKATPHSKRAVHLIDRPGAVQSTILIGLPVVAPSHPDYVPLLLTHTLLGGYFSSRITANIREQKGYTYSPFAQVSTRRGDAYWVEQADVTTAVTGASLKEILFEIDRLQAEPPSDQELAGVKNYMAGTFVLQNSSRAGILNQLQFVDLQQLPESYLKEFVTKAQAVTGAQVSEMAKKHLRDDEMTIVVVGDKKLVEEQLKPYGAIQ